MPGPDSRRDEVLVIRPTVTSRQLDDELVLLDLKGGEYYTLNRSGAAVWRGIERGLDLGRIDAEVVATWPVSPEQRWRMILEVVDDLLARGLVERRE
jgi:hypothetical protein